MRILHLANHCHEIGNGIMNVSVDLACEQAKAGHEVAFASAEGSFTKLIRDYNVVHHNVPQHWRSPKDALLSPWRLRRVLNSFKPDIVHAHMMAGALLAFTLRPFYDYSLVTTVHNEWQKTARLMGVADRIIAVSAAVALRMVQRGISRKKIRTVLNGPLGSPRWIASSNSYPLQLKRPSIVTVCGLYERKGVHDLIRAFERVVEREPVHLYIVGEGPDRGRLEELTRNSLGKNNITFTGFQSDVRTLLKQADIFVLASHNEPFGLVLAEAREAGCAVIGTNVGGIPEVLENGKAGILVPAQNVTALAEAILALLHDPSSMAHWKQRAQADLAWLSSARMAEETLVVYQDARLARTYPGSTSAISSR